MKRLLILGLILVVLVTGAWGPITHGEIATRLIDRLVFATDAERRAFTSGNLMPDMWLAYSSLNIERQMKMHNIAYWQNLNALAKTAEERVFAKGFLAHLLSDRVEEAWSAQQAGEGAPWPADYAVDGLLLSGRISSIGVSDSVKMLIVRAWNKTSPDDPWPTTTIRIGMYRKVVTDYSIIDDAVRKFNFYLNYGYIWAIKPYEESIRWYGDYEPYLNESVERSLEGILAIPTPTPIPTATPRWRW